MKLIWLTDVHFNFLNKEERATFYQEILSTKGDAILISGDIAEAPSVEGLLKEMAQKTQLPIYFVLGNHDYYFGRVEQVRQHMRELVNDAPLLSWLPSSGPVDLGNHTLLVGQDTWADGRYGDYANSRVTLSDSRMIYDLYHASILGKYPLLDAMQALADRDAKGLKDTLRNAIRDQRPTRVIILVHVPPFRESCLHEDKPTDEEFLPFFSSKVTGDALLEIARQHKEIDFLVLCGHTHSQAYFQPLPNLTVKAGCATYGKPVIQKVISI